jgi:PEP-CTERM motif
VKTDAWLRLASCAIVLCSAVAAQAAPPCAELARPPSWAECAAEFSIGAAVAGAAFDEPLPLQFDEDGAALASIDFSILAVKANGAAQLAAPSTVAAIPEPHTHLLMLAGLAAIAFMATRRRRP